MMKQPYSYQLLLTLVFFLTAQATSMSLPPQPLKKKESSSYPLLTKEKRALFLKTFQEEKNKKKWTKTIEMLKKNPTAINLKLSKEEQTHFPTDQLQTSSLMDYVIYEGLDGFVKKISEIKQVVKVLDFGFEELEQGQSPFDGFILTNLFFKAWDYTPPEECQILKSQTSSTKPLSSNFIIFLLIIKMYKEQTNKKENIDVNYILNKNYQNPDLLLSTTSV